MTAAVLTEPVSPGSHAGVLFMHNDGFAPAVDHGLVSLATIAIERGLIGPGGDGRRIVFDTVAGTIRVDVSLDEEYENAPAHVRRAVCSLVPSFVIAGGLSARAAGRVVPADIVAAGACYAVVDSEAAGVGLTAQHVPDIRRVGKAILSALRDDIPFTHPTTGVRGLQGVLFTGPAASDDADLRTALVFGNGQVAASPTESGSSAVLAVLDAIGLLADQGRVSLDSLTGAVWRGRIASRTIVGEYEAIVPEVEGSAWITGEHTFFAAPQDPLSEGFSLQQSRDRETS